jgi:hypothetical protein
MNYDNSSYIVSKVWNYAHFLKNAGVGYGGYIEAELDHQISRAIRMQHYLLSEAFEGRLN